MARKPRGSREHGDHYRYVIDKCRCALCREANRLFFQAYRQTPAGREAQKRQAAKRGPSPERIKRLREWEQANPEMVRTKKRRQKLRLKETPEGRAKLRERNRRARRAFRRRYPEKVRENKRLRGEIKRQRVFTRDQGVCYLCGDPVDPQNWHADHVIPLALGGSNHLENRRVTHPECNLIKADRLLLT